MSVTWTVFAVSLCMFASMQTAFTKRVKADASVEAANGPHDDEGCVPVSAELGARSIGPSDVILEGGSSYSSKLVKTVSGWDMSHVMIVSESNKESVSLANQLAAVHVWITEALEEGVKGRWLWNAMYEADFFRVHRMHCGPSMVAATEKAGQVCHGNWQKSVNFLDFHIGSPYGYSRLVDAGFQNIAKAAVNMGSDIWGADTNPCPGTDESEHPETFMCSEIVWDGLQKGNFLPDEIRTRKGMSPEQLEKCALAGERNGNDARGDQLASLFIDKNHIPWHNEMKWYVSEAQACLSKDMVISFLETLRMDRRMTFDRWSIAAQDAGHHLGKGVEKFDTIMATHARELFEESRVTGGKLMDGLLDAFIVLELTQKLHEQCQAGSYVFLYGVGFAAPKLEIVSSPFCKHGSLDYVGTSKKQVRAGDGPNGNTMFNDYLDEYDQLD